MSVSQALATPVDEIMESSALVPRNGFHLEPRCRICRNDSVRRKVNDLLATGASYAMVLRALAADNAELDEKDRVTVDSIRTHTTKHFPVQSVAKATYREIVERRARENQIDFVQGVATALTPFAYFEVVMNKAFRALVDDRTEVSVDTFVGRGRNGIGALLPILCCRSLTDRANVCKRDRSVALRRRYTGMPQRLLHRQQVVGAAEALCGEPVPQLVHRPAGRYQSADQSADRIR
jgi:hypothetical protein